MFVHINSSVIDFSRPLVHCRPVDSHENDLDAILSSNIINQLSQTISSVLQAHPINLKRREDRLPEANVILFRGAGTRLDLPTFHDRTQLGPAFAIAPTCMIAGWMQTIGVDLVSKEAMNGLATGDYRTDLMVKANSALTQFGLDHAGQSSVHFPNFKKNSTKILNLKSPHSHYRFGFVHIKAVDDAGHDCRLDLKIGFLEKIDAMVGVMVSRFMQALKSNEIQDILIVITGDHSTPVGLGDHSVEPVPVVFCRISALLSAHPVFNDKVKCFSEIDVVTGALGRFPGSQMISLIQQLIE
jgi:2,3-bisphosphoglycerate-independent phosphoglycerate mutase